MRGPAQVRPAERPHRDKRAHILATAGPNPCQKNLHFLLNPAPPSLRQALVETTPPRNDRDPRKTTANLLGPAVRAKEKEGDGSDTPVSGAEGASYVEMVIAPS